MNTTVRPRGWRRGWCRRRRIVWRWRTGWRRRDRVASQRIQEGGVGSLRLIVLIIEQRLTLTRKGAGNPGIWLSDAPDGDVIAAGDRQAIFGNIGVIDSLLIQIRAAGGRGHAVVQFGDLHVNAQIREFLQGSLEIGWHLPDDKV